MLLSKLSGNPDGPAVRISHRRLAAILRRITVEHVTPWYCRSSWPVIPLRQLGRVRRSRLARNQRRTFRVLVDRLKPTLADPSPADPGDVGATRDNPGWDGWLGDLQATRCRCDTRTARMDLVTRPERFPAGSEPAGIGGRWNTAPMCLKAQ